MTAPTPARPNPATELAAALEKALVTANEALAQARAARQAACRSSNRATGIYALHSAFSRGRINKITRKRIN